MENFDNLMRESLFVIKSGYFLCTKKNSAQQSEVPSRRNLLLLTVYLFLLKEESNYGIRSGTLLSYTRLLCITVTLSQFLLF